MSPKKQCIRKILDGVGELLRVTDLADTKIPSNAQIPYILEVIKERQKMTLGLKGESIYERGVLEGRSLELEEVKRYILSLQKDSIEPSK